MKIREILAQDKPVLSFEVFPPKEESAFETVEQAAFEIAELSPAFMSVTYGAGGGTSKYTVDIAAGRYSQGWAYVLYSMNKPDVAAQIKNSLSEIIV